MRMTRRTFLRRAAGGVLAAGLSTPTSAGVDASIAAGREPALPRAAGRSFRLPSVSDARRRRVVRDASGDGLAFLPLPAAARPGAAPVYLLGSLVNTRGILE